MIVPEQHALSQHHTSSEELNNSTFSSGSVRTDFTIAGFSTSDGYSATFAEEVTPMQQDIDGNRLLGTHETLAQLYFAEGNWGQTPLDGWYDPFTELTIGGNLYM